MELNDIKVVGLMSGTSLDGLDVAYCSFNFQSERWSYSILEAVSVAFPEQLHRVLKNGMNLTGLELAYADKEFGKWMGKCVSELIHNHAWKPRLIASHGQTIFHQPENGLTFQIGNGFELHAATLLPVVCDLRRLDVCLGGQGAPLVPVGDRLLFPQFDFCLNLGGFSNISYEWNGKRIAYDIGTANNVLNHLAAKLSLKYDDEGKIARSGQLVEPLFNRLNKLEYYRLAPPKSLGYEWTNANVYPIIDEYAEEKIEDLLCTYAHHCAYQVIKAVKTVINAEKKCTVLVTGGGAYNTFLIDLFKLYAGNNVTFVIPEKNIIEYKEALVFALLGLLKALGKVNVLKDVTGASADSSGGLLIDNLKAFVYH